MIKAAEEFETPSTKSMNDNPNGAFRLYVTWRSKGSSSRRVSEPSKRSRSREPRRERSEPGMEIEIGRRGVVIGSLLP